MGKFLGAMGLYVAMLAVTLLPPRHAVSSTARPGVEADRSRRTSGCCSSAAASSPSGLFISSLTKNQIVAGSVTFVIFLLLWVINWIGSFAGTDRRQADGVSVDRRPLRRLQQGRHRHDAPHLLPELHHVRPVPDGEVGRQRTVARLTHVNRIFELIGWIGFAAVLAAVGIRFGYPAKDQYATYFALRRPRLPADLHPRPVARHREAVLAAPGALRHADRRQRAGRARHPGRHQLHRRAAEQALGPDREQAVQPVGPDAQRPAEARRAAERSRCSRRRATSSRSATS